MRGASRSPRIEPREDQKHGVSSRGARAGGSAADLPVQIAVFRRGLHPAAFSNTGFVIYGGHAGGGGFYHLAEDGTVNVLVDTDTPLPDGSGTFTPADLGTPSVDAQTGAPSFLNDDRTALYTVSGGVVRVVADAATSIPGVDPAIQFERFDQHFSSDGGTIVFHGWQQSPPPDGIYADDGSGLSVIADGSTPIPGGVGNFTFVDLPVHLGGETVFLGHAGIYRESGGAFERLIESDDTVPLGLGALATGSIDYDGTTIAFEQGNLGVVTFDGSFLEQVIDYADLGSTFPISSGVHVSDGIVGVTVLEALSLRLTAYATLDGELLPLPEFGDVFDGKTVSGSVLQDVAGEQLLLSVSFSDGSTAGYLVTVPEPGSLLLLTGGLLGLTLRSRRARGQLPICQSVSERSFSMNASV